MQMGISHGTKTGLKILDSGDSSTLTWKDHMIVLG